MRAAGFEPLEPYPGSNQPWRCRCTRCGKESTPRYGHVSSRGSRCRYCVPNNRPLDRDEILSTVQEMGFRPLVPFPGNKDAKWRMECLECGNEFYPRWGTLRKGHGCPYCARRRVDPREAEAAMLEAHLRPLEPYPGKNDVPWRSECTECGRVVHARWASINRGQEVGCPYCAGRRVDLEEVRIRMAEADLQPLDWFPGSSEPWRSECLKCGREVFPYWSAVRRGIGGCKYCATGAFDFTAPAVLYLITSEELNAAKIGIASPDSKRIERHRNRGWKVARVWRFKTGAEAFAIEQAVLRTWRDAGHGDVVAPEDMPRGGHTETVPLDAVSLTALEELVDFQRPSPGGPNNG